MNELTRNRLVTRRGFLDRALQRAAAAGATGAWLAWKARAVAGDPAKDANPFAYDVSRFLTTDPKLVGYAENRTFRTPRPGPRALAIAAGNDHLFIAAGKYVTELKSDGAQVSEIALTDKVKCVAVAGNTVYVGLRDHIEVFDRKGQRQATWESPGKKAYLTSLAASENDVFVADAGQRVLLRYDRSGKLVKRLGEKNKERNIPGFIVPSPFFAVELSKDGLLRVTNPGRHRVEIYTADGDFEGAWGKPGAAIENFCGCCNPINLALLPDGRVVTLEKGIPRVKVHAADGTFESVVAGAESFAENARVCGPADCTVGGLDGAVDSQGRIYIVDFVANNVRVMERKA